MEEPGGLQSMGSQRVRHDWESIHFLKLCLELFTLWWVMLFLVVMYGCESWIIKKAEGWRIDVFKIWCWKRFLKVPWTARSNQSILRETNPKYSLEELMLSWSSNIWPRYAKNQLIGKDCDAGKDWNQKQKGTAGDKMVGWHHWLHGHKFEQTPVDNEGQGAWCAAVHWVARNQTPLSNWTTIT